MHHESSAWIIPSHLTKFIGMHHGPCSATWFGFSNVCAMGKYAEIRQHNADSCGFHIHGGVRQGFVLNPVSLNTVLEIALSSWNAKIGLHTSVGWTSGWHFFFSMGLFFGDSKASGRRVWEHCPHWIGPSVCALQAKMKNYGNHFIPVQRRVAKDRNIKKEVSFDIFKLQRCELRKCKSSNNQTYRSQTNQWNTPQKLRHGIGRHVADQLPQHNFADMRDCFLVLPCSFFAPKVLGSFHAQTLFIVTCLQVYFLVTKVQS